MGASGVRACCWWVCSRQTGQVSLDYASSTDLERRIELLPIVIGLGFSARHCFQLRSRRAIAGAIVGVRDRRRTRRGIGLKRGRGAAGVAISGQALPVSAGAAAAEARCRRLRCFFSSCSFFLFVFFFPFVSFSRFL